MPDGTQITIRPMDENQLGRTRRMRPLMSASAIEKSAMTPSLSGRMVSMSLCVRSCIIRASCPMATALPERRSMATMDGSLSTMPLSWTWMRVLAVPRSMATSTENGLSTERECRARGWGRAVGSSGRASACTGRGRSAS